MNKTNLRTSRKLIALSMIFILLISFFAVALFKSQKVNAYAESEAPYESAYVGRALESAPTKNTNSVEYMDWVHAKTQLSGHNDDSPAITFLVHGQGCAASYWSNDKGGYKLIYDADSMIETLRNQAGGADVYYAQSAFEYGLPEEPTYSYVPPTTVGVGMGDSGGSKVQNNKHEGYTYELSDKSEDKENAKTTNFINGVDYTTINKDFNKELVDGQRYNLMKSSKKSFDLFSLIPQNKEGGIEYKWQDDSFAKSKNKNLNLTDKHIIVVFGATNVAKANYNQIANDELHYIIDNLSYDYKARTGKVPKINIVGYSRGGTTAINHTAGYTYSNVGNRFYDHTYNVDKIFTLGSPLPGRAALNEVTQPFLGGLIDLFGMDLISCNSAKDMADKKVNETIKNNWKEAITKNPSLKLYAMGSNMRLSFVKGLLDQYATNYDEDPEYFDEKIDFAINVNLGILSVLEVFCVGLTALTGASTAASLALPPPLNAVFVAGNAAILVSSATMSLLVLESIELGFEALLADDPRRKMDLAIESVSLGVDLEAILVPILDAISGGIVNDLYNLIGDVVIDTPSQLGESLANDNNNIIPFLKTYQTFDLGNGKYLSNFDVTKIATNAPEVAHNLEARDDDLIAYIARNITLVKPTTIYKTSNEPDLTLRIHNLEYQEYADEAGNKVKIYPEVLDVSQTLGGFPVTAIGDKAFEDSENLQKLILPNTLQEVGQNIFKGCNQLKYVQQEPLETYSYVDLPKNENGQSITVIDNAIYSGEATKIIAVAPASTTAFTIPTTVKEIAPYAFYGSSIKSFSGGENLQKIGKHAFLGTPWFNSQKSFAVIGKWIVGYGGKKTEIAASDFPTGAMYIADGAFTKYENYAPKITSLTFGSNIKYLGSEALKDCISLEKLDFGISQIKSISEYAFSGCTSLSDVKLNNIMEVIGSGAFDGCRSLTEFELSPSLQAIGSNAFYGCENLNKIVARSLYPISLGPDAFNGCSASLKIYVPSDTYELYQNSVNWSSYKDYFNKKTFKIVLDTDGGNSLLPINAEYYGYLKNLPVPTKDGYDFVGWFDSNGNEYTIADYWNKYQDGMLTARWNRITYSIIYDTDGVDRNYNQNRTSYSTGDTIYLENIKKPYNTFLGWYDNPNFYGDPITKIDATQTGTVMLYAKWAPVQTLITDDSGANLEATGETVGYGKDFTLKVPSKESFIFEGWYSQDGIRYTDSNGVSIQKWDNPSNTVALTAKWRKESYVVKLDNNGNIIFVDGNGMNDELSSVLFGNQLMSASDLTTNFKNSSASFKEGHIFYALVDRDGNIINWTKNVPDFGDDSDAFVVTPKWNKESYTINFVGYGSISVLYDDTISFPRASKYGYTFKGWKVVNNNNLVSLGSQFNYTTMPDITPRNEGEGTISLEPIFEANKYVISFDSNGGDSCEAIQVVFDSKNFTAKAPTRKGYNFAGWYDSESSNVANGNMYFNSLGTMQTKWDKANATTLYAKWAVINYSISYNLNGGEETTTLMKTYTIEDDFIFASPTKYMYRFGGWYTDAALTIPKSSIARGTTENINLYAKWIGEEKTIGYYENSYTANSDVIIITYSSLFYSNNVIKIANSVNEITIIGNNNIFSLRIEIADRTNDLVLRLKNITLKAYTGYDAIALISAVKLNLEIDGTVNIYGGKGASTTNIGMRGNDGKAAINAENSSVALKGLNQPKLSLYGGNGGDSGNGANGIDGLKGTIGKNHSESSSSSDYNGGHGRNGEHGRAGQDGANGGYGIIAKSLSNSSVTLIAAGGNGGHGGDGGNGGRGGDGGNGGNDDVFNAFGIGDKSAGKGGNGGNGGNGGVGGAKGTGGYAQKIGGAVKGSKASDGTKGEIGKGAEGGLKGYQGDDGFVGNSLDGVDGNRGTDGINTSK